MSAATTVAKCGHGYVHWHTLVVYYILKLVLVAYSATVNKV